MDNMSCVRFSFIKKYVCDGSYCDARCCGGWMIEIDRNTYDKYKRFSEIKMRNKLVSNICFKDNRYIMLLNENNKCPFLREDFLCGIQKEYGEEYLSDICADYPRRYKIYNGYFSETITLSCPVAVKLLLNQKESIRLVKENVTVRRRSLAKEKSWKSIVVDNLLDIQRGNIALMQNQSFTIRQRLFNVFMLGEALDKCSSNCVRGQMIELIECFLKDEYQIEMSRAANSLNNVTSRYMKDFFYVLDGWLGVKNVFSNLYEEKILDYYQVKDGNDIKNLVFLYCQAEVMYHKYIVERYPMFVENYLVYQFYNTGQPAMAQGSIVQNLHIFLILFRIQEMALMVLATEKKEQLTARDIIDCVSSLSKKFEHVVDYVKVLVDYINKYQYDVFDFLKIWLPNKKVYGRDDLGR